MKPARFKNGFAQIIVVAVIAIILLVPIAHLANKRFIGVRYPWEPAPFYDGNNCPDEFGNIKIVFGDCPSILPSPSPSPKASDETVNPDSVGANWKTYEDRTLAVSMQYPSNWQVFNFEAKGGSDFPNKPTAKVSFNNPVSDGAVFISLYPNPQNLSLNAYISMQIKKESDYELTNGQNAGNPYILPGGSQISKLPNGLTANLKEKDDCDPFYCTTYIVSRPKAFYKIYFFEQTDKEIVNKMLTSLKFTN